MLTPSNGLFQQPARRGTLRGGQYVIIVCGQAMTSLQQVDKAKTANKADLDAFYQEQQKEVVERKLSKRRSNSIWTRKTSGKRTSVSPQTQSKSDSKLPQRHQTLKSNKNEDNEREMEQLEINNDRDPNTSPLPITRSIVPDSLNELPAWYRANDPSYYRSRFPMHNPGQ